MTKYQTVLAALAFATLLATLPTTPLLATEDPWRIHGSLLHLDPDLGMGNVETNGRIDADEAQGFRLGIAYRFHRRWSAALEVGQANPEVGIKILQGNNVLDLNDELSYRPVTLGVDFHLLPNHKIDLALGARLAWVSYGDVTLQHPTLGRQSFDADDDLGWSLQLGLDVPFGESPWSFNAVLGHVDAGLELTNRGDGFQNHLELDPAFLAVGVGYRF